jgi:hypothetical protein
MDRESAIDCSAEKSRPLPQDSAITSREHLMVSPPRSGQQGQAAFNAKHEIAFCEGGSGHHPTVQLDQRQQLERTRKTQSAIPTG